MGVAASLVTVSVLFERMIDRPAIKISDRIGKFFSSAKHVSDIGVEQAIH
jgi:hypothetical protein